MPPSFPELSTERLHLRAFEMNDLPTLYQIHADPEVVRYLYWDTRTLEETEAALRRKLEQSSWEEGKSLAWAVIAKDTGVLLGEVVLICHSEKHQQAEIGYVFGTASQGKGYAREAVKAVLEYAFQQLPIHRVYARTDARNHGSRNLLERLGLRQEAHFVHSEIFKGQWGDEVHYAVLEEEWQQKQDPAS
ncbi:GNAT family N-acetyltransferase [Deinococcus roseus]|uniref:N-acetyltransferase n=1 Tax=Deinococcus roseus TaxID=392414 RepID=A0ABQ2CXA2_9DEIO|nr:GNAT family N-acetyltransferase [Deinococcus roseus]GGJ30238.1 N-acetyltransferase [Deinococcus roseus]